MAVDFSDILVAGISARALFDLEKENELFVKQGLEAYVRYQHEHENELLARGSAFPLVEALLRLNGQAGEKLVEVVVLSKNSPDTGLRILNSIEHYGLDISRFAFSGGESPAPYLEAFDVDLFLTRHHDDVQWAIDAGCAAAELYGYPDEDFVPDKVSLRMAFDADAVIFSDESEYIFKTQGLEAFVRYEKENANSPLNEGPFAKLIILLSKIQRRFGLTDSPVRLAIVTARNSPAHLRVIRTLKAWEVHVDSAFFLGGLSKEKVLKAFRPHIFFDDQETHLIKASKHVPASKVPYKTGSPLKTWESKTPLTDEEIRNH